MIAPAKGKSASSLGKSAPQSHPTCIVPDCTRPAKLRGVCQSCYQNATKLIQRGGTTWEELERLGLVKPRHSGSGQRAALYRALAAARENEAKEAGAKWNGGKKASVKKGVKP